MKPTLIIKIFLLLIFLSSCKSSNKSVEKTIFIYSETKPCNSDNSKIDCLQVKWDKNQQNWEQFNGNIEGFQFEKGNEYELLIREEKNESSTSKEASVKWTLIKEISAKKITETITPNSEYPEDSSRNSLDWNGTYEGILPCADCEGIKTSITLNSDNTFSKVETYLTYKQEKANEIKGVFNWNPQGTIVSLVFENTFQQYQVGENQLFHLDNDGNRISGNLAEKYILKKVFSDEKENNTTSSILDKRWNLIEFMGKKITENSENYYLIFHSEDTKIETKIGCNQMISSYSFENEFKISISKFISTLMLCQDEVIKENTYAEALQTVNNLSISEDGKSLSLNKNRMAPIAIFKLND